MKFLGLLSLTFLFSIPTWALQLVENFTSATYKDSAATTAVWNLALGQVHPPLVVDTNTGDGTDSEDLTIDVGDGSDGSFDITTYAKFSVGGVTYGNLIIIDTAKFPFLQLTNFNLAPGWTIRGTGANPLWFKVQGTFINNGTINCSGGDGGAVTSDLNNSAPGGTGVCGGGSGGNGGATGVSSGTGLSGGSDAFNTGGAGTANTNAGGAFPKGGGGGGGNNSGVTTGGPGVTGGAVGACSGDPAITKFGTSLGGPGGGSGGGGGGAYLFSDGNQSRGGGGGAGGGVIRISAVGNIINNGSILARGGVGGQPSLPLGAGSGGGGGGGTIWLQSAGSISTSGTINALSGAGGTVNNGTGFGGQGCEGRTWLTASSSAAITGVSEQPVTTLGDLGQVHYSKNLYVAQSIAYDLRNTSPTYNSFSLQSTLPGTSTAVLSVAGSNDGFIKDNTGFLPTSQIQKLAGKRFLKFQLQLQLVTVAPNATTPATVASITAQYDGIKQKDFTLSPACGYIGSPGEFIFLVFTFGILWKFRFLTSGFPKARAPWRRTTTLNQN